MKLKILLLAAIMMVTPMAGALANHDGKMCPVHPAGGAQCSSGASGESQCPVTAKFMKKAHFILENKEALGLSEEQVKTIRDLKMEVAKTEIRSTADMQIFMIDIQSKLMEPKFDVEGTSALIDEGAAVMAEAGKSVVVAYGKLKGTLSESQTAKLKELWTSAKPEAPAAHPHG